MGLPDTRRPNILPRGRGRSIRKLAEIERRKADEERKKAERRHELIKLGKMPPGKGRSQKKLNELAKMRTDALEQSVVRALTLSYEEGSYQHILIQDIKKALGGDWAAVERYLAVTKTPKLSDEEFRDRFEEFRRNEKHVASENPAHLVRPSGSLGARISAKLHYPTFTTSNPKFGEVADASNPCMRLITEKGLTPSTPSCSKSSSAASGSGVQPRPGQKARIQRHYSTMP